jgi:hypothetical protein
MQANGRCLSDGALPFIGTDRIIAGSGSFSCASLPKTFRTEAYAMAALGSELRREDSFLVSLAAIDAAVPAMFVCPAAVRI